MVKLKLGRWIYCKYCYKNVKPELGGVFQILCRECGYGLTPDFFSKEGLMEWLKSGDYDKVNNLKEEKLAEERVLKAMKEGIGREGTSYRGRCMEDLHTSQPELRKISEETKV